MTLLRLGRLGACLLLLRHEPLPPAAAVLVIARSFAGHNTWSKIARGKGLLDAQRAVLNAKVSKRLANAVRSGSASLLTSALEEAKRARVPKDLVDRALKAKAGDGAALESIAYEGTGPGGAAIIVDCLTDSRNRSAAAVRSMLVKSGGALGGAAAWAFKLRARITVAAPRAVAHSEQAKMLAAWADTLVLAAADAGASDVELLSEDDGGGSGAHDEDPDTRVHEAAGIEAEAKAGEAGDEISEGAHVWIDDRDKVASVRAAIEAAGLIVISSEPAVRVPTSLVTLEAGSAAVEAFALLIEQLESNEDVQSVSHNVA